MLVSIQGFLEDKSNSLECILIEPGGYGGWGHWIEVGGGSRLCVKLTVASEFKMKSCVSRYPPPTVSTTLLFYEE